MQSFINEFHENMTVTTNEVAKIIKGLKRGKAVGPDNVAAEVLRHTQIIDCTIYLECASRLC